MGNLFCSIELMVTQAGGFALASAPIVAISAWI
jgi:hypothetical protein